MLITRTPFRVSFLGGGTDIPWFYEEHGGGAVLSTAIDKYMYLTAHPMFDSQQILLKYSQIELVDKARDLRHPIARAILDRNGVDGIDIGVSADIPAGTGLGSSSAFAVGLTQLAALYSGNTLGKFELAAEACHIELDILGEPIGKQDQYASAFGGFNLIKFSPDGFVDVTPMQLSKDDAVWLDNSLLLVRVGKASRSASDILRAQGEKAKTSPTIVRALLDLRQLTLDSAFSISQNIMTLGDFLNESWELKKQSNPGIVDSEIQDLIDLGLRCGALGAKLLGAGHGGFVVFLAEPAVKERIISKLHRTTILNIRTDTHGSMPVYESF